MFDYIRQEAEGKHLVTLEISPPVEELLRVAQMQFVAGQPQYLNFGFTLSGSFRDFGEYISQIEASPMCQEITRCQIVSTPLPTEPTTFHVRLKALLSASEEEQG